MAALNSWGVYMVAAFALLLVLSPQLAAASRDAREGVDSRNLDGVRAVLSSLRPGVAVVFSFGWSASEDPILAGGHSLSCSYGIGLAESYSPVLLRNVTLYPQVTYRAYLSGGQAVVVADV